MIAKEYIYFLNSWFKQKYNKKEITFINKESVKPASIKFGDRREYKVEIWMVNFVQDKKEKVFTVQEVVPYEKGQLNQKFKTEILKSLYILTFDNLNEIEKYGV